MSKRARTTPKKGDHHAINSDDFLSRLPDEIIFFILSFVCLKDAVVTSLLSRRWRYMWCQIRRLDFEEINGSLKILEQPKLRLAERNKFINRTNRVIKQHRSAAIEEFRICFNLDKSSKGAINNWIKFATSKNVQKLHICLTDHVKYSDPVRNFVFSNKILDTKSQSYFNVPRTPSTKITGNKFLKTLILEGVDVSDEVLGKILSTCFVLQHITIANSAQLVNVKITGPELALSKLEIKLCPGLQSVEIHDSNISSFKYLGIEIDLNFDRVPKLKQISIGQGYSGIENNMFQHISSRIPHLEVLELYIPPPQQNMDLLSLPKLLNVKELKLIIGAREDDSLLELTTGVVNACPNLKSSEIQLISLENMKRTRRERHLVKQPHHHLLSVGILGYYGRMSDLELALFFAENGLALRKMVIDTRYQNRDPTPNYIASEAVVARSYARDQLVEIIPHGVELVIL